MASLVPIDPKGISVHYHGLGRQLELRAEGEIPGYFLTPFFEQEIMEGGLRFSVKAYSGGFGTLPPTQHVKFNLKLPILLPIPHFNNKTVLIETAYGTSPIKIEYLEWPEPPNDEELTVKGTNGDVAPTSSSDKKDITGTTVLPPIELYLLDEGRLTIIALIPKELNSYLDIEFNPEFIRVVTTSVGEGFIRWTINWANIPTGADNPQRINVITTTKHDATITIWPPVAKITQVIQPYIVHRAWLVSDK